MSDQNSSNKTEEKENDATKSDSDAESLVESTKKVQHADAEVLVESTNDVEHSDDEFLVKSTNDVEHSDAESLVESTKEVEHSDVNSPLIDTTENQATNENHNENDSNQLDEQEKPNLDNLHSDFTFISLNLNNNLPDGTDDIPSIEIISEPNEKVQSPDKDDSLLAVVPPDQFEENSVDENDVSTTQLNNDEDQESQVPRKVSLSTSNQNLQKEELPDEEKSETNQPKEEEQINLTSENSCGGDVVHQTVEEKDDDDYSLSKTEFIQEKGSSIEENQNEKFLRKSFDLQEKQSFDNLESNEVDDVLGNKSLMKKIVRPGDNGTRPPRNSLATISYELFLVDQKSEEIKFIEKVIREQIFVGEYDILPAIDICVQLMDRGERSLVDSDIRHCYGDLGCQEKNIPPRTSENESYRMKIDLVLDDWKLADEISSLTVEQRIFWGDRKKLNGNIAYRRKEYSVALQCYRFALRFFDTNENPLGKDQINEQTLIDRFVQVENNLAQIFLTTEQYDRCLESTDRVLTLQTNNVKALFRRSRALIEKGDYEQALKHLKQLRHIESDEVEKDKVNDMLRHCQAKIAEYHQNQKELCQRMFQTSPNNSKTSTVQQETPSSTQNPTVSTQTGSWWPYLLIGGTALGALGLATFIKNR